MSDEENDYIKLQMQSVKDLIQTKHEMTQGAIDAQGKLIEAKIKGLSDKFGDHVKYYQEDNRDQWDALGEMQSDVEQAKGAMKVMKWVQCLAASAIAGLFALWKWSKT